MKFNDTTLELLTKQFNKLFITKRSKYLILTKNGEYIQANATVTSKFRKLNDYHIKRHLEGKETIGVFSGDFLTKFICFDVDFHDRDLAKWHTYKVIDTLVDIGIPKQYIHVSTSGNKGYHVEIYFDKLIELEGCKRFFELVIKQGDIVSNDGKVEFRPSQQGVKIPLGRNFKNKDAFTNICWYVDTITLEPITNYNHILTIEQIDTDILTNIFESMKDLTEPVHINKVENGLEIEAEKDNIDLQYKPLEIYNINVDPEQTIEAAIKLEDEGLTHKGSRHNKTFFLCRYYYYLGLAQQEAETRLYEWLLVQDRNTYTTPLEECKRDIERICQYIYDNNIGLVNTDQEIEISYNEMLTILKAKNQNDKLIAYGILMHSKRFANKNGIFYMTYNQMATISGLSERTCMRRIQYLEEIEVIEIIERNISAGKSKSKFKKPNKYRCVVSEVENKKVITINSNFLKTNPTNEFLYTSAVMSLFDLDELKGLLPKRQYYDFKDMHDNAEYYY
ncbi:TOTE conflict system archaeo-eukaryotic primase domain-containing protein [Bacillus sp. AG4(2022)]|uniref:TOTE conflict system archaeo-eukaryotic primase domain-containing protein n=1 Tax=Bacillus sp. AG4(2022) TaxID=2962594 RepID=UPI0028815D56|nr:hypothetical protein [Bacillus sp. AG4(2022)]MDT0160311.1 hypothetical protein [Bacillus sp. AG4(2022)]